LNRGVIYARSLARKLGLIRIIHRFRCAAPYEHRVHEALIRSIRPGDVVWDVGANVGVYTALFSQIVGSEGGVVAFEPLPESCEQIRLRIANESGVRIEQVALSDQDREGRLALQQDSVEHHIAADGPGPERSIPVQIRRGDTMLKFLERPPNVVKIDVEGFEEEVLQGMQQVLDSPALRAVLVEVHFVKLERRGRRMAPARIEKMLRRKGLRTTWVDESHLMGQR